ncbi:MAG: methyltransferase domain-containing protein [Elusimicrobia bacterium]|nr:methyltransferase domain-containing protein [Elusimicrobiota bacterium]
MTNGKSEAQRLEKLWSGRFGSDYVDRNLHAANSRRPFWFTLLSKYPVQSALEVGCNVGANLVWLERKLAARNVYGIDINEKALAVLKKDHPGMNVLWSPARDLPFRDGRFDLVFTMGVLIHQPPDLLPLVMQEIVRCSRRYVLCGEYFAETPTEIPYRGQQGALFKRDFGALYKKLFPELRLLGKGFLSRRRGWDDVTTWMFEKKQK